MRIIPMASAIILVLLCTCGAANAAMVDVSYDLGYTIKAEVNETGRKWKNEKLYTAEFDVTIDGESGYTGYCVDIFHNAGDGEFAIISWEDFSLSYLQAAYLMENYALGLNDEESVYGYSTKATITALSAAIWEVTQYNSSGQDLYQFLKSYTEQSQVAELYALMIEDVMSVDLSTYEFQYDYQVITNDKLQNLIVASEKVSGTPEPATLVLLGSALCLGAFFNRRRKS